MSNFHHRSCNAIYRRNNFYSNIYRQDTCRCVTIELLFRIHVRAYTFWKKDLQKVHSHRIHHTNCVNLALTDKTGSEDKTKMALWSIQNNEILACGCGDDAIVSLCTTCMCRRLEACITKYILFFFLVSIHCEIIINATKSSHCLSVCPSVSFVHIPESKL